MFQPYGIIPPVITPVTEQGALNELVFRQVISRLIEQGVHGIFPLGTSGEFYAFDKGEAQYIFDVAVDETRGRVPVYAGANSITLKGAIELVSIAKKARANAVSVLTPMFISQTQDEVYGFYEAVAKSTDMPIIVYNNKPKTNVTVEPQTLVRLAEIPNIIGVKDSTGDMTNTTEYIRLTRGMRFHVLMGRDTLIYAGLCCGTAGAIATCANVAPRLTADIYDKFKAGDLTGSLEAQFMLAPLRIATNMATFPEVIKEAMEMQGIPVGKGIAPIARMSDEKREKLRQLLIELKLL